MLWRGTWVKLFYPRLFHFLLLKTDGTSSSVTKILNKIKKGHFEVVLVGVVNRQPAVCTCVCIQLWLNIRKLLGKRLKQEVVTVSFCACDISGCITSAAQTSLDPSQSNLPKKKQSTNWTVKQCVFRDMRLCWAGVLQTVDHLTSDFK